MNNNPERKILHYLGRDITNEQLDGYITAFAGKLKSMGIGNKDVVTIALPNIPEAVIAIYAVNKVGGICNMVHPKVPSSKMIDIMGCTNSKVAVLVDEFYLKEKESFDLAGHKYIFAEIANFLPAIKKIGYKMRAGVKKSELAGEMFFTNGNCGTVSGEEVKTKTIRAEKHAPAVYLHSSGTTGEPKTVVLSNENLNFVAVNGIDLLGSRETANKGMLCVLPMFHGFGLCMSMHTPLVHNMACVLIPKFSPKAVVEAMKSTNVSVMCGVPKMFEKFVEYEKSADRSILEKLDIAFCGGDSLPKKVLDKFNALMISADSKCRLFQGYGLTECVAVCTVNTFADNKGGSCGKPIRGCRIKILDGGGNAVARGELGEIAVSAPSVAKGYLGEKIDVENGYLKTGDVGYIDDDGFLFFKQRDKHVLNVSGFNVYPVEIEAVANSHVGVKDCAVLKGVNESGDYAVLVVKPNEGVEDNVLKASLVELFKTQLEPWCAPKEIVVFKGELPYSMVGKVDLKKLEKMVGGGE